MSGLLLDVTAYNSGLSGPCSWESTEWRIRTDASYFVRIVHRPAADDMPESVREYSGMMKPEDFDEIRRLADEPWSREKVFACDGITWEFWYFADGGATVKKRVRGYIDHIEPFESMAGLLLKYDFEDKE